MTHPSKTVEIEDRDYWFKVVDMLQQNWALIDGRPGAVVTIFFIHDRSGVFDRLTFASRQEAVEALRRNGFRRYADDRGAQGMMRPPPSPFVEGVHPNGAIYSSGRYWR